HVRQALPLKPRRSQAHKIVHSITRPDASASPSRRSILWSTLLVTLMVVGACLLFFVISAHGGKLVAAAPGPGDLGIVASRSPREMLLHVLIALAAVIVTGAVLARLFAFI